MLFSNQNSTVPFVTKRSWGQQIGKEIVISDGYCWTQKHGWSFQKTSFFLVFDDQVEDAPNIVGGRNRVIKRIFFFLFS